MVAMLVGPQQSNTHAQWSTPFQRSLISATNHPWLMKKGLREPSQRGIPEENGWGSCLGTKVWPLRGALQKVVTTLFTTGGSCHVADYHNGYEKFLGVLKSIHQWISYKILPIFLDWSLKSINWYLLFVLETKLKKIEVNTNFNFNYGPHFN